MTSVLYSAGLNYQGGNPLRTEIRGLRASITALEALSQEQASQIAVLKAQTAALDKAVQAAAAAAAAATASASAATAAASKAATIAPAPAVATPPSS